jgi:hypothetical protein
MLEFAGRRGWREFAWPNAASAQKIQMTTIDPVSPDGPGITITTLGNRIVLR